ncbi:leucine-rich repeat domain-containing protein [uncultured Porphyromonas sp.]|uniref:leucine-rich repeat domain-containing protein n=1 Tax=uncultured Porphyromonas sp. TaxID=159274 RepID=UPI0028062F18|nr:leucine-rich repeat domain-containing protein [uncultured Porphyromonas sp.]
MNKQLRIWLFALLGTLLTSTALLAEGVITMTTSKRVGDRIELYIRANGPVSIDGVRESARTDGVREYYTLTSQTITIRGDVTYLNCSQERLTSLDVSGCTALTTLDCYESQLTSLNVSGCTALTTLRCWENQLTSLDVSGCTALTTLTCYNNQLTSLNAFGCTSLTSLQCRDNKLTNLNLSGCTALTTLDCNNNKLTSLNVSGCTSLTTLTCYSNQLTSLNAFGCTALTSLQCRDNKLTNLDLSGCTALTTLNCYINKLTSLNLSDCTALTSLYCSSNQLTDLNLSDCTALAQLKCYSNQLTSLDLSKNNALATIDCSDNKLPSLDLSGHKALTALNCSKNLLRQIDLSGCTSLLSLTCYSNQIKVREMTNLVNSLPDLGSKGTGAFRVFYDGSGEGNVCLAAHVATAQAKGWKTQFTRSSNGDAWYDYTGADNPLYAVSSSPTGGGSISITGADNLNAVPYGTELTVVATPADGYKLTKLTANGQDILQTKRFKVTENTKVEATFALQSYNVTPIKVGEGTFYISGADNLDAVTPGTELTITADPAEGYELTKLTANDKNVLDTKKVVVNEDMIIRAIFSKKTFKVSLEPRGKGTIKAVGADDLNAVPYGTELTIVATPDEGSELTSLIAGGINITETKKVTIKKETTIEAFFTTQSFAVKLTKEGEGTISATGADDLDAVDYGTELTIVATPAAGYKLTALTANGTDILATKKVVIKGATEVRATFVDHTGVETTVTQQVKLYPNPATDYVIVEGVAPASEVTLHSMTGERLYAGRADGRGTLQIDLTPYADGVYLVCVAGETYRVVVRH